MKKVFAVLFFLTILCNCNRTYILENRNVIFHKNENILSSIPGDFDGDKYPEYMYIANSDNKPYIKLVDGNRELYRALDFKLENYLVNIQDVNKDNKEDIILCSIDENSQKIYVFSYSKDIYTVLKPEDINNLVKFTKNKHNYTIDCGEFKKELQCQLNEDIKIKFFYTDLDYKEDEPIFESVGIISSKDHSLSTVSIMFKLDKYNKINIINLNVYPYIDPKIE